MMSTANKDDWTWSVGTSFASPTAAGIAALIISENGGPMHPAHVKMEMAQRAFDAGKKGRDDVFGHGHLQSGY